MSLISSAFVIFLLFACWRTTVRVFVVSVVTLVVIQHSVSTNLDTLLSFCIWKVPFFTYTVVICEAKIGYHIADPTLNRVIYHDWTDATWNVMTDIVAEVCSWRTFTGFRGLVSDKTLVCIAYLAVIAGVQVEIFQLEAANHFCAPIFQDKSRLTRIASAKLTIFTSIFARKALSWCHSIISNGAYDVTTIVD